MLAPGCASWHSQRARQPEWMLTIALLPSCTATRMLCNLRIGQVAMFRPAEASLARFSAASRQKRRQLALARARRTSLPRPCPERTGAVPLPAARATAAAPTCVVRESSSCGANLLMRHDSLKRLSIKQPLAKTITRQSVSCMTCHAFPHSPQTPIGDYNTLHYVLLITELAWEFPRIERSYSSNDSA